MTIRKLVVAVILSLFVFTSDACFARISTSDLSIGGVYLNQNFSDVISIYGQPLSERYPAGYGKIYSFARGASLFDIHVTRTNVVKGVTVLGNNGLALDTSGIKYGSTLNNVIQYYGYPDHSSTFKADNGQIILVLNYFIRNQSVTQELAFYIDKASGRVEMFCFDEYYG